MIVIYALILTLLIGEILIARTVIKLADQISKLADAAVESAEALMKLEHERKINNGRQS